MKITPEDLKRARFLADEPKSQFCQRFGVDRTTYIGWEKKIPTRGAAPALIERVLAELSVQRSEMVE